MRKGRKEDHFFENSFSNFGYHKGKDSLYCITNDGYFVVINCKDFGVKYLSFQIEEGVFTGFSTSYAITCAGKLFFFDYSGQRYLVLDIEKSKVSIMSIPNVIPTSSFDRRSNILALSTENGCIYCFIRNSDEVIEIDALTNKIVNRYNLEYSLNDAMAFRFKNELYIILDRYQIAKFIDRKLEIKELDVGENSSELQFVCADDETIYMLTRRGKILFGNLKGIYGQIDLHSKRDEFALIVNCGKRLWAFPYLGEDIIYIENGEIRTYDEYCDEFMYGAPENWFSVGTKYYQFLKTRSGIVFPPRASNMMALITNEGVLEWKRIEFSKAPGKLRSIVKRNGYICERNGTFGLNDFLDDAFEKD